MKYEQRTCNKETLNSQESPKGDSYSWYSLTEQTPHRLTSGLPVHKAETGSVKTGHVIQTMKMLELYRCSKLRISGVERGPMSPWITCDIAEAFMTHVSCVVLRQPVGVNRAIAISGLAFFHFKQSVFLTHFQHRRHSVNHILPFTTHVWTRNLPKGRGALYSPHEPMLFW